VLTRFKAFYKKYERWVPIASFAAGFVFDASVLKRIDEPKVLVQQAIYILVSGFLVSIDLQETISEVNPPKLFRKVWKYREAVLHFLLGTLLNSYTIFYFKSSSSLTSLLFIGGLVALLMLNEFKHFGKSQTQVHVALLSLCVTSYLVALVPILFGFIGIIPFLCAVLLAALCMYGFFKLMTKKLGEHSHVLRNYLVAPFIAIQVFFVALYVTRILPPVPLSVIYMGVYHKIEKSEGKYMLSYTRSKWLFWQHGDQTFSARPGDVIYLYSRVFSPARFKEQLEIRWYFDDPKHGWVMEDQIPLNIEGGREEGYRGQARKSSYLPGKWKIQIETSDGREVGRLRFNIENDDSTGERELTTVEE
jgi:hypothetical protein